MHLPPYAPTLTDGVVTLRAHREGDVEGTVAQCNDPESIRWTTVPVPYETRHAQRVDPRAGGRVDAGPLPGPRGRGRGPVLRHGRPAAGR